METAYLFEYEGKRYGVGDIVDALKKTGIKKGDTIFIHSDIGSFGKVNPTCTKNEYVDGYIHALQKTVSEQGTVLMPTFTYSFCKGRVYDPDLTPSTVGILTERFRSLDDVLRTDDPIFSAAALGKNASDYLDVGLDCFGEKSIFEKLYLNDVKLVFLGETFNITFMHFVEQACNASYRYLKRFTGTIEKNGVREERTVTYNVRRLDEDVRYDLEGIASSIEQRGLLRTARLGHSQIRVVSARDAFRVIADGLKENPRFILRDMGTEMHNLAKRLFPICRSITGNGVRETLAILREQIPIEIKEVPSGTKAFDWTVPDEWNIRDAYVKDEQGNKIIDFKKNNLHVAGYSIPIQKIVSFSELNEHLHSLPDQPNAIPYITSYYKRNWGFCISHDERKKLKNGQYQVVIDSELKKGSLTYGELVIPGTSEKEVFLSTYVCHPSMANNELSGPVVTSFLAKWLLSQPRTYTYRIIFIPETIGSIVYLSKHLEHMKKNVIAGFNITCVGDTRAYGYLPSRVGNTLADRAAQNVLSFSHPDAMTWSFLDRQSDERQYNAPGVDLPVCSIMRSKYGSYPEYHTSLDNLDLVRPEGLYGSYEVLRKCLKLIEENHFYKVTCLGEPQLGVRGLYPTMSTKKSQEEVRDMRNVLAYADGKTDLITISDTIHVSPWDIAPIIETLVNAKLLVVSDPPAT